MHKIFLFILKNYLIFFLVACNFYNKDFLLDKNVFLVEKLEKHKKCVSEILGYKIFGIITYSNESKKAVKIKFIWEKNKNNIHYLTFLDFFGFIVFSLKIEDGTIKFINKKKDRCLFFEKRILEWVKNTNFCVENLQQWVLGLPGYNTKYFLNKSGYLDNVQYRYNNQILSIFYLNYCDKKICVLPNLFYCFYKKNFFVLKINQWDLKILANG